MEKFLADISATIVVSIIAIPLFMVSVFLLVIFILVVWPLALAGGGLMLKEAGIEWAGNILIALGVIGGLIWYPTLLLNRGGGDGGGHISGWFKSD